ncbi:hypothetical protein [Sulfobacillus thermosulfidooxidans]|uniref:hypothetical protein n=1 Tax=Sulfobacillus thermosulfidooxidans TaxID=28034 RepID=UPI0006B697BF|nr:hypothetical protein [Sulfobacillus thermosulfidooxidans]
MQPIYVGWDPAKAHDQEIGHQLFDRHATTTQRHVEKTAEGIRTVTTSHDAVTVQLLQDHVLAMESRMKKGLVMRRWDPFFPELFRYADEIDQTIITHSNGVEVRAQSSNPYVVKLLHIHADAVSDFAERGWDAAHDVHGLPSSRDGS